jgi:hypothetical protein
MVAAETYIHLPYITQESEDTILVVLILAPTNLGTVSTRPIPTMQICGGKIKGPNLY